MTFNERIRCLDNIMDDLRYESSMNGKRDIVDNIPDFVQEDFDYILECLAGRHPFGYKWWEVEPVEENDQINFVTVKQALLFAQTMNNRTNEKICNICRQLARWRYFFKPIINRTLRLGIGQSMLDKVSDAPMLAKKLDDKIILTTSDRLFVTEKLDGNRCIARYDLEENKWKFTSRNGKPMNVSFDMSDIPRDYIYDGEILSTEQTELSKRIYTNLSIKKFDIDNNLRSDQFSKTSGLINSKKEKTGLVYNIFDIQCSLSYAERREILTDIEYHCKYNDKEIRILPVLFMLGRDYRMEELINSLNIVTRMGGEGLMVNLGSRPYEHKRTSSLLKYKGVQTMDMRVMAVVPGTGKYELAAGALLCEARQGDTLYSCSVGTGLSDMQRYDWLAHPEHIVNAIVEVAYFDLSQSIELHGTKQYSLRFPRLKSVRFDKKDTSVF